MESRFIMISSKFGMDKIVVSDVVKELMAIKRSHGKQVSIDLIGNNPKHLFKLSLYEVWVDTKLVTNL